MIDHRVHVGRLLAVAAVTATLVLTSVGCTNSPKEQTDRERKAAGVPAFKLHMDKDLWTRTSSENGTPGREVGKPKNMLEDPNGGMATIELTGPQMVDYLEILDYNAHGGSGAKDAPLANAVYDTVAPVVDKIQTPPPADAPEPEITINAAVIPASTSTTSPSASAVPK